MNRSTRIKACVLSVVFSAVLLLCPFSPAYADSFPSAFNLSNNWYSSAEIYVKYNELTLDQQDIANYLFGMYNLFYLGSRGFQFIQGSYSDESAFVARVKTLGYRLFYNASGVALQSRMDDQFLRYASSVLLYASQCNTDFSTWFTNLDDDFIIPVDSGILNSFTLLYNDNSDLGISVFNSVSGVWNSGVAQTFAFEGLPFYNTSSQNQFNSFISTTEDIMLSNPGTHQVFYKSRNHNFPDTLFILDGSLYSQFRFGYDDNFVLRFTTSNDLVDYMDVIKTMGKIYVNYVSSSSFSHNILTLPENSDLSDFIDYVFAYSNPLNGISDGSSIGPINGSYTAINHVILVDDLTTLSNPREVFASDINDIIPLNGNMVTPIDKVGFKPKLLTTINLPDNTGSSVSIRDMINDDNVVDDDDEPVDPWQVHNIVQPNDTNPISIDVNFFSGGKIYLEYLWEHTRKVVVFTKDVLDCFEFDAGNGDTYGPKYAIYGVLVLGIAGGLIAKFLL